MFQYFSFFLVVVLQIAVHGFSQETTIQIQGKILDSQTRLPLAYANVYLRGKSIGTISNEIGEFDFKVPSSYKTDTLTISYVGYESYYIVISKADMSVFYLKPSVIQLAEIQVNDVTAENMVRKAIDLIDKNYPTTPYILKAFYRDWKLGETTEPDSSTISLLEAAITIYDEGYKNVKNKLQNEDVFLDEVRRSKSAGTIYNYLDLILKQNFIRYNRSKNIGGIFSPFDFAHDMKYEIESVIAQESGGVYLITAVLPTKLGRYELYINQNDFSFLRINFKGEMAGDSVLGIERMAWDQITNQLIFVDNTLVFRKYNNHYFPNYIKLNWRTRTQSDLSMEIVKKKEFFLELLINEIITEGVEVKKQDLTSPMSARTSLEQQVRSYNKTFWENFNIVKENPLDRKVLRLIEKDGKINEQFMNQKADPLPLKDKESKLKGKSRGDR